LLRNVKRSRVSDCLIRDDREGATSVALKLLGGSDNTIENNSPRSHRMSKPRPELYQDDALDRARACSPFGRSSQALRCGWRQAVTGLFAAIAGWFGIRWLTIAHLYETGIVLLLTSATFLAIALGMFWLSRRLYPRQR
jgi:hypothetical protein